MSEIVSILFILEFFFFIFFFFKSLKKDGLTFKLGITLGVLYFIFIPVFMMILTGTLILPKVDFGSTSISDIVLQHNIPSSFVLILFLSSILFYLYIPKIKSSTNSLREVQTNGKWRFSAIVYLSLLLFIFIGSGMLKGGNWYDNRHDFMVNNGFFAVFISFLMSASKVLLIVFIINYWMKKSLSNRLFFITIFIFVVFDMLMTGNRIYAFITFSIIFLLILKTHFIKVLKYSLIGAPLLYFAGYFASIFRHMRGPLFEKGFPSLSHFQKVLTYAINHEPPDVYNFFSGISESVNVNVIYGLFNRYSEYLYGASYLKTFLYPIPRSIWHSKPISITNIAGDFFGTVSLVTTFIGEMFMNFSYFGIILLPLFLLLTEYSMKYLFRNYSKISNTLLFFLGLMIFRMPFSDSILVFVLVYFLLRLTMVKWKLNINKKEII